MAAVRIALVALGLLACRAGDREAPEDPAEAQAVTARARELAAAAAAAEPAISRRVQALSAELGGRLSGFEHRLKTLGSLERKIRSRTRANPELSIAEPDIVDALRYTIVFAPGPYTAASRAALAALEREGHEVVRVKNYWPRGDNYSGVNVVLSRGGLQWELQFHTPESVAVRDAWHPGYERLRELTTPRAERRWLYELMAVPWDQVEVPPGAETAGNIHAREKLRRYPPP